MSTSPREAYDHSTRGAWAYGLASFGGAVLLMVGLFQFLQGLSAALKDDVYLATPDYLYSVNLSAWGWINMAIGAVAIVIGLCILSGQTWARAVGILIAVLSAVSSFAFLPHYPVWALLVIAVDVLVIWALASLVVHD